MKSDEQIEYWVARMKGIVKITAYQRNKKHPTLMIWKNKSKTDWAILILNFEDEYIEDVMRRLAELRGLDSLPS